MGNDSGSLERKAFPFSLPLRVDKIRMISRKVIWWLFPLYIILFIVVSSLNPDSMIDIFAITGILVAVLLVWAFVLNIIRSRAYKKHAPELAAWLEANYDYRVLSKPNQLYPFFHKISDSGGFSYASDTVMLWDTRGGLEIATPYSLVETSDGFALYNLNLHEPELTADMKRLVEFWEFFWTFGKGAYIPVRKTNQTYVDSLEDGISDHDPSFDYVNFSSPLDEFSTIKMWGDEDVFLPELEKGTLPYGVISISSLPLLARLLRQFDDGNAIIEVDFRNRTTRVPVQSLLKVIELTLRQRT